MFLGIQWESDSLYKRISNFLMDFYRGIKFDMISLKGIDHILSFTVVDGKIYMRGYAVSFRKSGTKVCLTSLHIYMRVCYSTYCNKIMLFYTHSYTYTLTCISIQRFFASPLNIHIHSYCTSI